MNMRNDLIISQQEVGEDPVANPEDHHTIQEHPPMLIIDLVRQEENPIAIQGSPATDPDSQKRQEPPPTMALSLAWEEGNPIAKPGNRRTDLDSRTRTESPLTKVEDPKK